MTKKVKNGIIKYYCDCCGALLYDEIPEWKTSFFGMTVPVYGTKTHKKGYIRVLGKLYCNEECRKIDKERGTAK